MTHSALHNLAIPYIYSRFDIVWPDGPLLGETRSGVDALTYGLSTLVMSMDVFGDSHAHTLRETASYTCVHCGETNSKVAKTETGTLQRRYRKGNYFAQYTRKFSLGNGPPKWVKKYFISKESGKMLGTLVALAVARMPRLETFMWDMPTGILRDVWVALSSLGDCPDGQESRLERIWIRWHDNHAILALSRAHEQAGLPHSASVSQSSSTGAPSDIRMLNSLNRPLTLLERSYKNIEHPNLSILPPLKSVTVLDIDEPAYLNELSILVERSIDRLRELRIGTASVPLAKTWSTLDQNNIATPNTIDPMLSYLTSGGILGLIMSGFYDCRGRAYPLVPSFKESQSANKHVGGHEVAATVMDAEVPSEVQDEANLINLGDPQETPESLKVLSSASDQIPGFNVSTPKLAPCIPPSAIGVTPSAVDDLLVLMQASDASNLPSTTSAMIPSESQRDSHHKSIPSRKAEQALEEQPLPSYKTSALPCSPSKPRKLSLETLELERVPINTVVLQKAIDWLVLTSLTLLNCESDEELWKALRRTYSPRSKPVPIPSSTRSMKGTPDSQLLKSPTSDLSSAPLLEYRLKLRKIHTNNVTPGLITFLKEALAPNSLEWLFLQEGGSASGSKVTLDTIYRGPLRRHRASLTKLMIDGTEQRGGGSGLLKGKMWILNREILTFITSGKMTRLRELAMVISFKEWVCLVPHIHETCETNSMHSIISYRDSLRYLICALCTSPTFSTTLTTLRNGRRN